MQWRTLTRVNGRLIESSISNFWAVGDLPDPPIPNLPLETSPTGGFRSFTMFWLGGLAALAGGATGQPIILRTATIPFLGGSLRRGGW